MQNLLLNLETEFYLFTGIDLEGISGLFLGLTIFCLFLFIFILGHFTYYIKYYTRVVGTGYPQLVENLYLLLPNFEYFGVKNHLIAGKLIPPSYFLALLVFSLAWTTLFVLISQVIFAKKSFQ